MTQTADVCDQVEELIAKARANWEALHADDRKSEMMLPLIRLKARAFTRTP